MIEHGAPAVGQHGINDAFCFPRNFNRRRFRGVLLSDVGLSEVAKCANRIRLKRRCKLEGADRRAEHINRVVTGCSQPFTEDGLVESTHPEPFGRPRRRDDGPPLKKLTSALLLAAGLSSAGSVGANTEMQDLSYSLGALIGDRILAPYTELDYERLMEGLKAAHQKGELDIDLATANTIVQEQSQKAQAAATEAAREAGVTFLAEQAARDGVMATDSGLLYEVRKEGDGAKPAATDQARACSSCLWAASTPSTSHPTSPTASAVQAVRLAHTRH